jgi:hypothetical protein
MYASWQIDDNRRQVKRYKSLNTIPKKVKNNPTHVAYSSEAAYQWNGSQWIKIADILQSLKAGGWYGRPGRKKKKPDGNKYNID